MKHKPICDVLPSDDAISKLFLSMLGRNSQVEIYLAQIAQKGIKQRSQFFDDITLLWKRVEYVD